MKSLRRTRYAQTLKQSDEQKVNKVPQWVELFDFYTPDEADNILLKTIGCCFIEFINKINLISIIDGK